MVNKRGVPLIPFMFEEGTELCNQSPKSDDDDKEQCKLSYKYKTHKLFAVPTNSRPNTAQFHVSSAYDQGTRVSFNRSSYKPERVYIINILNVKSSFYEKHHRFFPIVKVDSNDELKNKKEYDEQQLIIQHSLVNGESNDLLWLVIPITLSVLKKEGEEGRSEEPDGLTESFRRMVHAWLDSIPEQPVPTVDDQLVQNPIMTNLNDMIPVNMKDPKRPYTYIRVEDKTQSSVTHHILHFKFDDRRYIRIELEGTYFGKYNKQQEKEIIESRLYDNLNERNNKQNTRIDVFNSEGKDDSLLKNLDHHVSTRKKVNMKCRPVEIGGGKYEDKFILMDKKTETDSEGESVLTRNKFFGFSFVILVLMILLVPIGVHYLTKSPPAA